jgi:AraC-like DNA-binding protein/mannose-6-phosphate isomerase-like protein (cupin superfamily)
MVRLTTSLGFTPFDSQSEEQMSPYDISLNIIHKAIQHGTRFAPNMPPPLHQHEEHEVNLVLQGFGQIMLAGGQSLAFGAGQLLFLPSGLAHRIASPTQLVQKGFHLHPHVVRATARHELETGLWYEYGQVPAALTARLIHTSSYHLMLEMIESSIKELHRPSVWQMAHMLAVRHWLCVALLRILSDESPESNDCFTHHRIARVKIWIDENFTETVTLRELALMADLSPAYFSVLFQRMYHVAPKTYQRQCCLHNAARLLLQSDLPIKVIGSQNGFVDLAHFSRVFREYMGLSPRQYRQANRAAFDPVPLLNDESDDDTVAPEVKQWRTVVR